MCVGGGWGRYVGALCRAGCGCRRVCVGGGGGVM